MIPFEAFSSLYIQGASFLAVALIMFFAWVYSRGTFLCESFAILAILFSLGSLIFFVPIFAGMNSSENIIICNHQMDSRGIMTVMDSNSNTYKINDQSIQMRVRDGVKTNVEISTPLGYDSFIYKSDLPVLCGNQTCGVSPT